MTAHRRLCRSEQVLLVHGIASHMVSSASLLHIPDCHEEAWAHQHLGGAGLRTSAAWPGGCPSGDPGRLPLCALPEAPDAAGKCHLFAQAEECVSPQIQTIVCPSARALRKVARVRAYLVRGSSDVELAHGREGGLPLLPEGTPGQPGAADWRGHRMTLQALLHHSLPSSSAGWMDLSLLWQSSHLHSQLEFSQRLLVGCACCCDADRGARYY